MPGNERALGPYKHGQRYRVIVRRSDGTQFYASESEGGPQSFTDYEGAFGFIAAFNKEAKSDWTIEDCMTAYLEHLRTKGGLKRKGEPLKPITVATAEFRLRGFFGLPEHDKPLSMMTVAYCKRRYDVRAKAMAVVTQRNELISAKMFGAWLVKQGRLKFNPLAEVEPIGAKNSGKLVLKTDHARVFMTTALAEGSEEGLALALVLALGLRVSELIDRVVDDININPLTLNVPRAKTKAGERLLAIPGGTIARRLMAHVKGKALTDKLFGEMTRYSLYHHVERMCKKAGVPVVCLHGLRGSASTNIVGATYQGAGAAPQMSVTDAIEQARRQLGHENASITRSTYIAPGTEESAIASAKVNMLMGTDDQKPFPETNEQRDNNWN